MVTGISGWNKGMKRQPDGSYAYPPKPPAKLVCACGQPVRIVLAPRKRDGKTEVLCEACAAERGLLE